MNSLALKDVDNEVLNEADEYLRKHKILELFEVNLFSWAKKAISSIMELKLTLNISLGFDHSSCLQAAG